MDVVGVQYDFPVFTDSGRPGPHPSAYCLPLLVETGWRAWNYILGLFSG